MNARNGSGFRLPDGVVRTGGTGYALAESNSGCKGPWPGYYRGGGRTPTQFAAEWTNSGLNIAIAPDGNTTGEFEGSGIAWVSCAAMPTNIHHMLAEVHIDNPGDWHGNPSTGPGVLLWVYQDPINHAVTAYGVMVSNTFAIPPADNTAISTIPRIHIIKYTQPGPIITVLAENTLTCGAPAPDGMSGQDVSPLTMEAHIIPSGPNVGKLQLDANCPNGTVQALVAPADFIHTGSFGVICFGGVQDLHQFYGFTFADGTAGILSPP